MTDEEVRELPDGLYELTWTRGRGTSVAAVGRDRAGATWYAPTNWATVPWHDWSQVASVRPLAALPVSPGLDETARGLLCAALAGDGEALTALVDWWQERHAPADAAEAIRARERERCAREADDYAERQRRQYQQNPNGYLHAMVAAGRDIARHIRGVGADPGRPGCCDHAVNEVCGSCPPALPTSVTLTLTDHAGNVVATGRIPAGPDPFDPARCRPHRSRDGRPMWFRTPSAGSCDDGHRLNGWLPAGVYDRLTGGEPNPDPHVIPERTYATEAAALADLAQAVASPPAPAHAP